MTQTAKPSKGVNVFLWLLQILTAAAFLAAGGAKLAGVPQMVGVGQWFRYVTGLLEVLGGIGLLIPRVTFYAAALLAIVMVGAIISHLTVLGGSPAAPIGLLVFSGVIAYFRRPV